MSEVKQLDLFKTKKFTANGHNYSVSSSISIARWREYEKLEPRLTFGLNFDDIFKQLRTMWDAINTKQGNVAEVAVILHNLMNGISEIESEKREHPALLMAALVINREGEASAEYNEQLQLDKIEDWRKEGYDVLPFFTFALSSIQGFRETYVEYISNQIQKSVLKKK